MFHFIGGLFIHLLQRIHTNYLPINCGQSCRLFALHAKKQNSFPQERAFHEKRSIWTIPCSGSGLSSGHFASLALFPSKFWKTTETGFYLVGYGCCLIWRSCSSLLSWACKFRLPVKSKIICLVPMLCHSGSEVQLSLEYRLVPLTWEPWQSWWLQWSLSSLPTT